MMPIVASPRRPFNRPDSGVRPGRTRRRLAFLVALYAALCARAAYADFEDYTDCTEFSPATKICGRISIGDKGGFWMAPDGGGKDGTGHFAVSTNHEGRDEKNFPPFILEYVSRTLFRLQQPNHPGVYLSAPTLLVPQPVQPVRTDSDGKKDGNKGTPGVSFRLSSARPSPSGYVPVYIHIDTAGYYISLNDGPVDANAALVLKDCNAAHTGPCPGSDELFKWTEDQTPAQKLFKDKKRRKGMKGRSTFSTRNHPNCLDALLGNNCPPPP